jgi:hypothetical protein
LCFGVCLVAAALGLQDKAWVKPYFFKDIVFDRAACWEDVEKEKQRWCLVDSCMHACADAICMTYETNACARTSSLHLHRCGLCVKLKLDVSR